MQELNEKIEGIKSSIAGFDFGSIRRYSSRISVYSVGPEIPVIRIDCGKIGVAETSQIMKAACELAISWNYPLVFDLSECQYLSSLALGSIARLARHRTEIGLRLVFAGSSNMVREVIRLSNLDEFIDLWPTVNDAVKAVSVNQTQVKTSV